MPAIKPRLTIITGSAGSGKTFLAEAIKKMESPIWDVIVATDDDDPAAIADLHKRWPKDHIVVTSDRQALTLYREFTKSRVAGRMRLRFIDLTVPL